MRHSRTRNSTRSYEGLRPTFDAFTDHFRFRETLLSLKPGHGLRSAVVGLVNTVVFSAAFFAGVRLFNPEIAAVLNRIPSADYRLGPYSLMLSTCIAFALCGAVASLWTRSVWLLALPSAVGFLVAVTLFAQAIYLTDSGDPEIMWQYIRPGLREVPWASAAVLSATIGWWVVQRRRRRPIF